MAEVNQEGVIVEDINRYTVKRLKRFLNEHCQIVSGSALELRQRAFGVLRLEIPSETTLKNADRQAQVAREIGKYKTPLDETLPKPDTLDGWNDDVTKIPDFSERELYNCLVLNNIRTFDKALCGAVRQLKAKTFYQDNHVHSVCYHNVSNQCSHAYVRCLVIPSLPILDTNKQPDYRVCQKQGESCNQIAFLLYSLINITEEKRAGETSATSLGCKWNTPRPRKLSPKKAEEMKLHKYSSSLETSAYKEYCPSGEGSPLQREKF
ncbi:hypothetical protein CHS0354_007831 [Potamilus streckersoni]|uniref:Uncharacterized protein n=1 Tax=Potamilus streckersoni TaxID=2493646 RepID=A0AAE0SJU1_9BIVA|nr:hypothetical protein CHS0354_007831 [Potamilus streckersoni]